MKHHLSLSHILHIISTVLLVPSVLWYGAACVYTAQLSQFAMKPGEDRLLVLVHEFSLCPQLIISVIGLILVCAILLIDILGFRHRRARLFSAVGSIVALLYMIYFERITQLAEYIHARYLFAPLIQGEPARALMIKYILWGAVALSMLICVTVDQFRLTSSVSISSKS